LWILFKSIYKFEAGFRQKMAETTHPKSFVDALDGASFVGFLIGCCAGIIAGGAIGAAIGWASHSVLRSIVEGLSGIVLGAIVGGVIGEGISSFAAKIMVIRRANSTKTTRIVVGLSGYAC
jgi:hypothetical protein